MKLPNIMKQLAAALMRKLLSGAIVCVCCYGADCGPEPAAELNRAAAQLFAQAKYAEAAGNLKCSLEKNAKQPRTAKLLGLSAQLAGDLRLAVEAFQRARSLDGSDSETQFYLGRIYYEQNFFDRARAELESAVRSRPADARVHHVLALTMEAQGLADSALPHHAQAARLETLPARAWSIHLAYGTLLHKLGKLADSEKELKLATGLGPEQWQSAFELAKLYRTLGRLEDSRRELEEALSKASKPDDQEQIRSVLAAVRAGTSKPDANARTSGGQGSFLPITFVNTARQAGVEFVVKNYATPSKHLIETMPGGVAVFDFDNDGFEDLYFTNGAPIPGLEKIGNSSWDRLYRNKGDGSFADVTQRAGVAGVSYSMAASAADYDNDGDADLFIAGVNRNILYRNNGDGTFSDVTLKARLKASGEEKMWSISGGWFDFDNDGWLDLFVVNYCKWIPLKEPFCGDEKAGYRTYCHPRYYEGLPNTLYRNNGDGTFTDVSGSSGIASHVGKGMAVAFADYDEDGWTDAFVTNDTVPNFLFRNLGNGKFAEAALTAGVAYNADGRASSSMGVDFRDFDGDGRPDILITALSNETFSLFRNAGGGQFEDVTYPSGLALLTLPWSGWSVGLFDFNNDGARDIFTANSHVLDNQELTSSRTYRQPNLVLANTGDGHFADARPGSEQSVWPSRAHRGSGFGDFDNDGRVDVVVTSLNEPAELLRNVSEPRQHWLQLLLTGSRSNRDAIGARVRIELPSGRVQHNQVSTAVGYASSSSRRVHFGLGKESRISRLEILWTSGRIQTLKNIAVDRLLRVTEP